MKTKAIPMKMILTQWYLVFLMHLKWAKSEMPHIMEQEFIADYLDANPDLQPTFVVRTDVSGFAEFGLILNLTLYSCIYYEEREIEAVVKRLVRMVVEEKDLYGNLELPVFGHNTHNVVFFIGAGHGSIIQVAFSQQIMQVYVKCFFRI